MLRRELLAAYNTIDVALDPFPYSGGLTTCEALWMGVPVVTCPGETFASRHSLSHLSNVGLTETVAEDPSEYVERAVRLARTSPTWPRSARGCATRWPARRSATASGSRETHAAPRRLAAMVPRVSGCRDRASHGGGIACGNNDHSAWSATPNRVRAAGQGAPIIEEEPMATTSPEIGRSRG